MTLLLPHLYQAVGGGSLAAEQGAHESFNRREEQPHYEDFYEDGACAARGAARPVGWGGGELPRCAASPREAVRPPQRAAPALLYPTPRASASAS